MGVLVFTCPVWIIHRQMQQPQLAKDLVIQGSGPSVKRVWVIALSYLDQKRMRGI